MSCAPRKRKWTLTIGSRLTFWGAGITLGVCLLLCLSLYAGLRLSLLHEIDAFLEGEVSEFRGILAEHPGDFDAAQKSIRLELGQRIRQDLSFRLLDEAGRVLVTSEKIEQPPGFWMPPNAPTAAHSHSEFHTSEFHTLQVPGIAAPVRLCSRRFLGPDGQSLIAQAGYRLDQMAASLARFWRMSLMALAVAAAAALWGGRIVANRSLRPIQSMIGKAQQISERRLDDRLPCRGTADELDRLAETLNDMLDRVHHYVRRMQQFTADASHELRSPLAALRGNAEVMLTRPRTAEELRQAIEDSVDHYARLGRIAEDLLLLARLDAGEDVLRRDAVRLDLAVANIVDLYAPLADDAGIELRFVGQGELQLDCDGERIRQVIGNLIDNAIKFTNPPGRIEVALARTADGVRIMVSDSGVGISPDEQERVFDRFFQADPARSRQRCGGAGLGLSICRSIVEAHGGRIDLAGKSGQGTTATVWLPG